MSVHNESGDRNDIRNYNDSGWRHVRPTSFCHEFLSGRDVTDLTFRAKGGGEEVTQHL